MLMATAPVWLWPTVLVASIAALLLSYVTTTRLPRWLQWYSRSCSAVPPPQNRPAAAQRAPVPTTWISREEAARIIRRSSLIRLRVEPGTITILEALLRQAGAPYTKTPGEVRADELTRKLLRDFAHQYPPGVRDGHYGKELLEWWIDEQADSMNP